MAAIEQAHEQGPVLPELLTLLAEAATETGTIFAKATSRCQSLQELV